METMVGRPAGKNPDMATFLVTFAGILQVSVPHSKVQFAYDSNEYHLRVNPPVVLDFKDFVKEFKDALFVYAPVPQESLVLGYKGVGGKEHTFVRDVCHLTIPLVDIEAWGVPGIDCVPADVLRGFPECGRNFHVPRSALFPQA